MEEGRLEIGISQIFTKKFVGSVKFEQWSEDVRKMIHLKKGETLYNLLKVAVIHHVETMVRQDVLSSLHNNFLATLNEAWREYIAAMDDISAVFWYMEKYYVLRNNLDNVHNLGLIIFRDQVVCNAEIHDHLRHTLLNIVNQERKGEVSQGESIKAAYDMLMALGMDSPLIYEEVFERPFLAQSAEFYKAESQRLLSENSTSIYLNRVEILIIEESERAKNFLNENTEQRIVALVEQELIQKQMKTIVEMENSGFGHMLKHMMTEDLARMYKLLGRVTGGHQIMISCFSAHLRAEGNLVTEAGIHYLNFVQSLLDMKDRYDNYLAHSFEHDPSFKKVITSNFEHFLNLNPKSPEYLSLFIDDKLKTGVRDMTEQDIETVLDKTIVLFRFLREKDTFEIYYKRHLASRLLLNKSVSDDSEKDMISRLKTECGYQFTSKMEGMFKDMSVTNTINDEFKNHIQTTGAHASLVGMDLNVRVLSMAFWRMVPPAPCNLPLAASEAFNIFKRFYLHTRSGRQLTLNPCLGNADLSAVFYGPRRDALQGTKKLEGTSSLSTSVASGSVPRRYMIEVSTHQMCILMLFNSRDRLTYEDILNETNIQKKDLDRALQSLALGKTTQRILLKTPKGKDIFPSSVFCVNDSFTSKLHRFKIQTVKAKNESEPERKETQTKVEEDRRYDIEAAIVRIMKANQSMEHNVLVAEVTEQLKSRFLPLPLVIKQRIEALIEREYLARSEEDRKIYKYLA